MIFDKEMLERNYKFFVREEKEYLQYLFQFLSQSISNNQQGYSADVFKISKENLSPLIESDSLNSLCLKISTMHVNEIFNENKERNVYAGERSILNVLPLKLSEVYEQTLMLRRQYDLLTQSRREQMLCHFWETEESYASEPEELAPALHPAMKSDALHFSDDEGLASKLISWPDEDSGDNICLRARDQVLDGYQKNLADILSYRIASMISASVVGTPRSVVLYNVRIRSRTVGGTVEHALKHLWSWQAVSGGYTPTVDTAIEPGIYRFRVGVGTDKPKEEKRNFHINQNGFVASLQV